MNTLYVYFDESGDFNFSPRGSSYYVFTVAWTFSRDPLRSSMVALRDRIQDEGVDLYKFHASEDRQQVRDRVFDLLEADTNLRFNSVVVEKRKLYPHLSDRKIFYLKFAQYSMNFVLRSNQVTGADLVVIYTDTIPIESERRLIEKTFKQFVARELSGVRYHLYHHPSESNYLLQATDYLCWAVFRKYEKPETRHYDRIRNKMDRDELNLFRRGTELFY